MSLANNNGQNKAGKKFYSMVVGEGFDNLNRLWLSEDIELLQKTTEIEKNKILTDDKFFNRIFCSKLNTLLKA